MLNQKDKLEQQETLARSRAHELIQLGQDKRYCYILFSILHDEFVDIKTQYDRDDKKFKILLLQNKAMEIKLDECQRETLKWQEFSKQMEQVDLTMKGIKSQMLLQGQES